MADRSTFNGASTNVPWQNTADTPEGFGNQYARHIKALYDASALPLTAVGGTGDNVTATVDPELPPGGLLDGMKFGISWAATNSGPMTLKIGSAAAAPVLSADGAVAAPGLAALGGRALLEYVGGAFRVLSGGAGSGSAARYYWQFTASGTWTKPAGLPDDTMVAVEMWGGGGGGASVATGGSGGGGGYAIKRFRLGDLPGSVPVTVGAGGAVGAAGGSSTFGSLLTAYHGGGRTGTGSGAGGAGGGGEFAPGGNANGSTPGVGGALGGGNGSEDATGYGGGGGAGGSAVYGGGGGNGGKSYYGGNGGDVGQPGIAPGGGGGRQGAGARGEVRIWI